MTDAWTSRDIASELAAMAQTVERNEADVTVARQRWYAAQDATTQSIRRYELAIGAERDQAWGASIACERALGETVAALETAKQRADGARDRLRARTQTVAHLRALAQRITTAHDTIGTPEASTRRSGWAATEASRVAAERHASLEKLWDQLALGAPNLDRIDRNLRAIEGEINPLSVRQPA